MLVSATDDRIRGMMRPGPLPTEEKQLKGCIWRNEAAHPGISRVLGRRQDGGIAAAPVSSSGTWSDDGWFYTVWTAVGDNHF